MESNKQGGRDGGRARLPASVDAGTCRRPGPWPPASARETGALAPLQAPPRRCSGRAACPPPHAPGRQWLRDAVNRLAQKRQRRRLQGRPGQRLASPSAPGAEEGGPPTCVTSRVGTPRWHLMPL